MSKPYRDNKQVVWLYLLSGWWGVSNKEITVEGRYTYNVDLLACILLFYNVDKLNQISDSNRQLCTFHFLRNVYFLQTCRRVMY